ncbi:uncharacterized protein LOC134459594 [Engraulis encrasicolus]|uniref:uncharacterized protein LOC134459594 n=1 Tax=Engraulis encrasicolus TaxID=184585 RepID=UPI002FCFD82F
MRRFFPLLAGIFIVLVVGLVQWKWEVISNIDLYRPPVLHDLYRPPVLHEAPEIAETIQQINDSRHLMVSAFKDHRKRGVIRVISILKRWAPKKLYCVLCVQANANANARTEGDEAFSQCESSKAVVKIHSDHFGFPYGTSDILCNSPSSFEPTHVAISKDPIAIENLKYLPIQNQEPKDSFKYNFTVCISNLFGEYNNALQFVQTMEVYKLIGVQRVVIYNTSSGPDLEKVLKHYSNEGMLEVVPWPIDKFLKPSNGWRRSKSPGQLHYYGQLATLNECIYRYMYQSKYLLLNDIDEIVMPYKHASLGDLMNALQKRHRHSGVFLVQNAIYPKTQFDDSGRFSRPEWQNVPDINILEHVYREPGQRKIFRATKMIINPRFVVQTSVHSVLKHFGPSVMVRFDVCHIIHVKKPRRRKLDKDQLQEDKRLWEFEEKLLPNINRALNESGLLL